MIRFSNVCFQYKSNQTDHPDLAGIDLTIKDGELVVITGESGCGKTTLIRLINGLSPNYYHGTMTGEVYLDGESILGKTVAELGRKVGSVFQNPRSQFFNVDTDSELAFAAENIAMDPKEILERMEEVTVSLDLNDLRGRSIFELSGGEKQRIACGSVAVMHPGIIVLDEPSSNLDSASIDKLTEVIKQWKRQGKTVLIAEHRLYYLRELADRLVYMKEGRIAGVFEGREIAALRGARKGMGIRPFEEPELRVAQYGDETAKGITIGALQYSYHKKEPALSVQNLHLPLNRVVAIIGKNGIGKSTFLKCLCGIYRPVPDKVFSDGNIWNRRARGKDCYMVFQDVNHQLFTESVLDELIIGMRERIPEAEKRKQALEILDRFGLIEQADCHPMALSGGQKQRVAIASSVAAGRDIILMDEPTSGMDERNMIRLSAELKRLKALGKTVCVVTHDHEFINECCDAVIALG